jgi:uncharacterized Tic20 family protein
MKSNHLANQVKLLRTAKGYSQDYLAEQTKLSLRTIQRIESGQTEPHGDTLQRLASCLDVHVTDLLEPNQQPTTLLENKSYLMLLHLSGLSFLIFPLLGVIMPLIFWMLKRDQISGMAKTGKKVLNFQITWLIILVLFYGFLIMGPLFNIHLPFISSFGISAEVLLLSVICLYGYNIILVLINAILEYNNKRLFYIPALRLLR